MSTTRMNPLHEVLIRLTPRELDKFFTLSKPQQNGRTVSEAVRTAIYCIQVLASATTQNYFRSFYELEFDNGDIEELDYQIQQSTPLQEYLFKKRCVGLWFNRSCDRFLRISRTTETESLLIDHLSTYLINERIRDVVQTRDSGEPNHNLPIIHSYRPLGRYPTLRNEHEKIITFTSPNIMYGDAEQYPTTIIDVCSPDKKKSLESVYKYLLRSSFNSTKELKVVICITIEAMSDKQHRANAYIWTIDRNEHTRTWEYRLWDDSVPFSRGYFTIPVRYLAFMNRDNDLRIRITSSDLREFLSKSKPSGSK